MKDKLSSKVKDALAVSFKSCISNHVHISVSLNYNCVDRDFSKCTFNWRGAGFHGLDGNSAGHDDHYNCGNQCSIADGNFLGQRLPMP